jgi:cystathionine beta-synthase
MFSSIIDAIGNTPLVRLPLESAAMLYAKLEYLNPGGSVKDRSAKFMIEYAEKQGWLKPGGTLIDASSGNQGIATAMIGACKGYKVIITVSEKISAEKLATIKAYGAQVVMCPATEFIDNPKSYHSTALRIHRETPNSFMPNQYFNPLNAQAHYTLLGPEIWQQTNGSLTHFFAGAGTCGTITGVGRFLKEKNAAIKVIAIDSHNSYRATNGKPKPYKIEGLGIDFESPVVDYSVIDEIITVTDQDTFVMLKYLATHGFLVGPTSGAVAHVAHQYVQKHASKDIRAILIFGDSGRAYLSKGFYDHTIADTTITQKTPPYKSIETVR